MSVLETGVPDLPRQPIYHPETRGRRTQNAPKGGRTYGICYKSMRRSWTTRGIVVYGKTDHLTSTHIKSVHRFPSLGYRDGSPRWTRLLGLTKVFRDQPSPPWDLPGLRVQSVFTVAVAIISNVPSATALGSGCRADPQQAMSWPLCPCVCGAARAGAHGARQGLCQRRASSGFTNPGSAEYCTVVLIIQARKCSSAISTLRPKFINFWQTFCANPDLNE